MWIKISDQPPPENVPVQIVVKSSDCVWQCTAKRSVSRLKRVDNSISITTTWSVEGVSGVECENDFAPDEVTHWRHLSENPTD